MRPLGNRVLVRMEEVEEYKGAIHIPDTVKESPSTGVVVDVGPKVDPEIKIGLKVLCPKYGGLPVGDTQKLFISEEIFGVYE